MTDERLSCIACREKFKTIWAAISHARDTEHGVVQGITESKLDLVIQSLN